jgi:hypothetical protein
MRAAVHPRPSAQLYGKLIQMECATEAVKFVDCRPNVIVFAVAI